MYTTSVFLVFSIVLCYNLTYVTPPGGCRIFPERNRRWRGIPNIPIRTGVYTGMSEKLEVGSIVEGKVVRIKPFGAIVSLGNTQGLVHI